MTVQELIEELKSFGRPADVEVVCELVGPDTTHEILDVVTENDDRGGYVAVIGIAPAE